VVLKDVFEESWAFQEMQQKAYEKGFKEGYEKGFKPSVQSQRLDRR